MINKGEAKNSKGDKSASEFSMETFPNPWKNSDYEVQLILEEFACLSPAKEAPLSAVIYVRYVPKEFLLDPKKVKLYLEGYRSLEISPEVVINKICHDLAKIIKPKWIEVRGEFDKRDGVKVVPIAYWPSFPKNALFT